jgi:hypothetical protein
MHPNKPRCAKHEHEEAPQAYFPMTCASEKNKIKKVSQELF